MGKGASLGKEAVLADSGWVGEVVAWARGNRRPSQSWVARFDGVQTRQEGSRWEPDAGVPHVRIDGAVEGNPSCLLRQLSEGAGCRPTPTAWRSTARSSSRSYGLVR